ncbi:MAG TPA: PAS domain S-box protein [Thermoanaerobaculia bacterium]|nr:PAS domain S-box protein [Thermoanaerobaculia bacterium]
MSTESSETVGRDRVLWVGAEVGALMAALAEVCEVETVASLELAVPAVKARRPDAVIARKEEGGLDLLRELASDPRICDVPLILLGGSESEDRCLDAMANGAADYLIEPFSSRALAVRVSACLRTAASRRQAAVRERDLLAEAQMATESLDRSERRFHAFLNNSPVAAWITDEEGRMLYLSEPYSRMFGIAREAALGKSVFDLFPASNARTIYDNIRAVAETGGSLADVEAAPRPDGSLGHFLVYKFPLPDDRGRFLVGAVAADITEMKQAEEALRQSEERFRLATEAVTGMIYDWSLGSDHVQRSPGLFGLIGYWPGEVESRVGWWRSLIHPDDVERVHREIWNAIEGGSASFSSEYRVRRSDGCFIHVWDKGLIVRDDQGQAARVVGSTIDISDRKRAQEELERAHREAQAANEAKDRFLATLSHELRTPLTPVLAVLSRLEMDPRLDGQAADLTMIRRNVELEARLIDDLLDLTRIARGKLELVRRRTDARQVLEHALATAERELMQKSLRLEVWLTAESHRVIADAPRLIQVFWNLLSNAVKFTPPGGTVAVRSRLETSRLGARELVVEVSDSGIGIEPDALPRIFDAFEQTDRSITRKFGGLGLGLAVSRAIVDLHGGRLTAASEGRDRGATFTVRLPLGGALEDLDETGIRPARPLPPVSIPAPAGPLRLLLVEDHQDTAEAMADLLRLSGHQVTIAGSVSEALAAAEAGGNGRGFDLVLSDLGLPDGTGQDLMRELVRRHGLKGIALSGYGMEDDVQRSREAGFAHHLTKPIDRQALETTIRQVVSGI